jgi:hypothetical protein
MWNDVDRENFFGRRCTQVMELLSSLKTYLSIPACLALGSIAGRSARICLLYLLNWGERRHGSKFT